MGEQVAVPNCPGCHFGCSLDLYKCGRGKGFYELWKDGGSVPERRMPPVSRQASGGDRAEGAARAQSSQTTARHRGDAPGSGVGGAHATPPVGARVMHGLNIMANVLQDRHTESADRKVLGAICRQGGFFALGMLSKRTLVDGDALSDAIDALLEAGYVARDRDSIAGDILRATEAGAACQAEWDAERETSTAEFLSPLTQAEQEQLASMLFRVIQHARHV